MSHFLTPAILGVLRKATASTPRRVEEIDRALRLMDLQPAPGDVDAALASMLDERLLATCRITRAGETIDVYWPTGLKPRAAIIQPPPKPETKFMIMKSDSQNTRLVKAIEQDGPIYAAALSEKTGIFTNSIDGCLAPSIKSGVIVTRQIYAEERGRMLKHYMTAAQAQALEAQQTATLEAGTPTDQGGAANDAGEVIPTQALLDEINMQNERIHTLLNDAAAANLIFTQLADTLKVQQPEQLPAALDELLHALSTRAMAAPPAPPAETPGKLALLLIDSADQVEVEALHDGDDAQTMAMTHIELGHAARVVVVRILGEAQRRVEWKEAA